MTRDIAEKIVRLTDEYADLAAQHAQLTAAADPLILQSTNGSPAFIVSRTVLLTGLLERRRQVREALRFYGVHLAADAV